MTKRLHIVAVIAGASLALGGCGSSRLAGFGGSPVSTARAAPAPLPVDEPVVASVPAGAVSSQPLAPLGGAPAPASPLPDQAPAAAAPPQQVASAAPPSRSGAIGGWNAREATGTSCRIQLSSAPALDLYKASSSGCSNRDLAKITAWDYREGDVYLYQPGGTVAARLRSGAGTMEGVLTKSGAPLSLVR